MCQWALQLQPAMGASGQQVIPPFSNVCEYNEEEAVYCRRALITELWHPRLCRRIGEERLNQSFDGGHLGAVLIHLEERNLNDRRNAATLKDWAPSPRLFIDPMGIPAFETENLLHFLQTTNDIGIVALADYDSRFVIIASLEQSDSMMPKKLAAETPALRHHLENMVLPLAWTTLVAGAGDRSDRRWNPIRIRFIHGLVT